VKKAPVRAAEAYEGVLDCDETDDAEKPAGGAPGPRRAHMRNGL